MKQRVLAAITVFVVLAVVLIMVRQRSGTDASMEKRINRFLSCVPDTLSEEQMSEVKASLEHFKRMSEAGKIAKKDQEDVVDSLDRYIEAGSITRQELQVFLAKVGYYAIRLTTENQDIEGKIKPPDHPLLENGGEVDSSSYR